MRQMYQSTDQVLSDVTAGAFMARVYRWMFAGLGLTAVTALLVAMSPPAVALVASLRFPLIIAQLGLVLALSFMARRVSGPTAAAMFIGYSVLNGLTFSAIFFFYQLGSIASAFFITSGAFAALSVYATVTKRDLSAWRTFLFIGLIGVVLAGLVNLFVHSGMLMFVINCAAILVFAGLTAYDTQRLRAIHATAGYNSAQALAVTGALMLYLDFINLFLQILSLMSGRRRD